MINNRYKIIKKIGEGRNKVFLCNDLYYDKQFAMKVLQNNVDQEEIEAFRREFFILSNFNSSNIVKVYERNTVLEIDESEDTRWGIHLDSRFIILEYINGLPLSNYSKIQNEKVLLEIIKQISSTLYYLHQSNYIYYDLKPENILVKEIDGNVKIKFIDFGFAVFYPKQKEIEIRGTAEYIAPEILKKEFIDYRCDLYSFGILLYRIIYNCFPFDTDDELDIYKSHIVKEFKYPKSNYSERIISAVKKLLQKDPSDRFTTSLDIMYFLDIPPEKSFMNEWVGAKCFSGRGNSLAAIDTYLLSNDEGNVLSLRGTEASGKTTLLKQIEINAENVLFIKHYPSANNFDYWKFLIEQLFYNNVIYKSLEESTKNEVRKFLVTEPDDELIERVKAILLKLTNTGNFIVLIDDINLADEFSILILKQFVQVLQVNNIKTVIAENSEKEYFSQKINNCQIYNLVPFTKDETDLFLETSYAGFFPKNLTLNLIMKFADLLPGSIVSFIKDLITLEILEFSKNGPSVTAEIDKLTLLEKYQSEIFKLRVDKLEPDEIYLANVLSLFDSNFTSKEIQMLLNLDSKKFDLLVKGLNEKNIIANENLSAIPAFVNQSLKKYIYAGIENRSELHLQIGSSLKKHFAELHLLEQGRQFELAGNYEQSFLCYWSEIQKAKKISAYSYELRILYKAAAMPLSEKEKLAVNFELCKVLLTIDALNECLERIDETSISVSNDKDKTELEIIKGNCLIKAGQLNEGIELLQKSISKLSSKAVINELKLEIASAEFDLGNYSLVKKLVTEVINSGSSSKESIGRSYTILGLIEFYENTNLDNAIVEFTNANQIFSKHNLVSRQAGIELNLGNLYDILGDTSKAEKHWDKAVELNLAVGNFEQEAYIQLNYGIYYFNKLNFEKSIKLYKRALNVFNTTGNLKGQGLVLSNLGEVYTTTCEYQLSIDTLEKAESIFMKTRNIEEEVHVIFLICKLYYILGLFEQLKSKVNSLENIVSRNKISTKHELYIKYHNQMLLILDADKNAVINELINIRDAFEKHGEKGESIFLTIQIAYQLLKVKLYSDAEKLLRTESFNKICKQNKLIFAEREFILGLIASENNNTELLPSIEHFEKAFNYLENESITELTWKVTFKIAEYYFNRGNLHKAKEYIVYSKSLLKYISGGIKNLKIRNAYLSKNERSFVLETLEKFENKY